MIPGHLIYYRAWASACLDFSDRWGRLHIKRGAQGGDLRVRARISDSISRYTGHLVIRNAGVFDSCGVGYATHEADARGGPLCPAPRRVHLFSQSAYIGLGPGLDFYRCTYAAVWAPNAIKILKVAALTCRAGTRETHEYRDWSHEVIFFSCMV